MRKFFAILTISIVFCLTACNGALVQPNDTIQVDTGYAPLYVDVIAYTAEQGDAVSTKYEIQLGTLAAAIDDKDANKIMKQAGKTLGVAFDPISELSNDNEVFAEGEESLSYYCFLTEPQPYNITAGEASYGFFTITRKYTLSVPEWIGKLLPAVVEAAESVLPASGYKLDDKATRIRFCFGASSGLSSPYATKEYKEINSTESAAMCLVFAEIRSSYELDYKAMASGWYIIPIILGIGAVVVLWLVTKKKKPQLKFKEEIDPFETDNIIDGQISLDEWQSAKEEGSEDSGETKE